MEQAYKELYIKMNHYLSEQNSQVHNRLSLHVPMVGNRYYSHQNVRLLWVGRAINGWDDTLYFDLPINEYIKKINSLFHDNSRFEWLNNYNHKKSAFWRTSKLVCEKLHGTNLTPDWYNDIAWTNLYSVAPADGGNPNASLCKAQQSICGQLLKAQIKLLQPTHIVFVTDWNWFSEINQILPSNEQIFPDIKPVISKNNPIAGQGTINESRVVIAKRPEFRFSDPAFADAIIQAFTE